MKNLNIAVPVLIAAIVVGSALMLKPALNTQFKDDLGLDYEMPRPKSFRKYSFGDRKTKMQVDNPFKTAAANAAVPVTPALKPIAQKPADKNAKKNAKTQTPQQKVVNKNKNVETQVVDKAKSDLSGGEMNYSSPSPGPVYSNNPTQQQNADVLTYEQWRARLLANPTMDNLNALLESYNRLEIDPDSFYKLMEDLLSDTRPEAQKIGLYGLNATPSARSFELLAKTSSLFHNDVKTLDDKVIEAYAQASRLSYMTEILKSDDKATLVLASYVIEVAVKNYRDLKQSDPATTRSGREVRGLASPTNAQVYTRLIPLLQQIIADQDTTTARAAQSALNQINSIVSSRDGNIVGGSRDGGVSTAGSI